jgi:hypothetical protein
MVERSEHKLATTMMVRTSDNTMVLASVTVDANSRRVFLHWRADLKRIDAPCLILDADLEPIVLEQVVPKAEVIDIRARRNAKVVQVVDNSFARRNLLPREGDSAESKDRASSRLREIDNLIQRLSDLGRGLVVTYKELRKRLTGEDGDRLARSGHIYNADVIHFGAIRGRDEFKDHDWVMIVGRQQLPPTVVEDAGRALFYDAKDPLQLGGYSRVWHRVRLSNGAQLVLPSWDHPDHRVQAINRIRREAETRQGIDRIRLIWNGPKPVFLISSQPVGVPIDRALKWEELLAGGTKLERLLDRFDGILPLSARWLAAHAADLFPDRKAAENWVTREYPQIAIENLICGMRVSVGRYRAAGKGGRTPTRFLCLDSLENPRAALEHLVGELAEYAPPDRGAKPHGRAAA